MAQDPFLEAGISIPTELPYKEESQRDESSRRWFNNLRHPEFIWKIA